jgi:predicted MPP superfamily phosphohydrolase
MGILQQLIFVSVFLTVMALTNLYVYRRFFRQLSPIFHRVGAILMSIIMLGEFLFVLDTLAGLVPSSLSIYIVTSVFIGSTFMLFVVALVYDLIITTSRHVPFDQERRRTIKVIFDITMLVAAAAYLLRGFSQGAKPPVINDVIVRIKDFPFNGYTIVQLTDIHIGRILKGDFVADLVSRTNEMQPDMVVITGDLFDMPAAAIKDDLQPLKNFNAPCYFITGNHEYFHGVEANLELMRSLGIRTLTNQHIVLGNQHGKFNLVGINDLVGNRLGILPPDVEAAYAGLDPSRATIVLSHQPKSITLVKEKRCDLMLSGHTHGGQIFPFGLLVKVDQPYLAGLYDHTEQQQIFVSRGTGFWGPPLRVLAPSEISRIVITSA